MGGFIVIVIIGLVLYFILKGKKDRPELLGASHRPMGTGPLEGQGFKFVSPYPKCPTCGGSGDKMKADWDGMRTVKWSCEYCGSPAGVQQLKDEELPPSARQRLGLDAPPPQAYPQQQGYNQGPGLGDIIAGVVIGEMLSGGGHHSHSAPSSDDWGSGSSDNSSSGDWGSGDSGGGSSDWGGGDSGGDSGGSGGDW